MKRLGKYLLADNLRAALAALVFALATFVLPTGFIAAIIVALVALQKGIKSSLLVLAFVLLPALAFLVTKRFDYFYRFDFLLVQCVLIWLFALVLRYSNAWHWVLDAAAALGVIAVAVVHLVEPQIKQTWVRLITDYLKSNDLTSAFHMTPDSTTRVVGHLSAVATGGFAFYMLLGAIILLILARWWQSAIYAPGRLQQEFHHICIDRVMAVILIAATIGLYWRPDWLVDMYPLLLLPFMMGGLSVLHRLVANRKELRILLVAVYVALLLLTFFMVILLALIGFIDSWYDCHRQHKAVQQKGVEK